MGIFKKATEDGIRMGLKMYHDSLPPEEREAAKAELKELNPEMYADIYGDEPSGTLTFTVKAQDDEH